MAWVTVHQLLLFGVMCIGAAVLSGTAGAQTTQPIVREYVEPTEPAASRLDAPAASSAPDAEPKPTPVVLPPGSWGGGVQRFVSALAAGEMEAAWTHVGPRARIDEFDPDAPATFARLTDMARRTTMLGVHFYESSPTTLAEDIASDVREAEIVPEDLRKRMMPRDEDEAARANATAAQWMVQNLTAEKGDPLAAVVLWDPIETQVLFILLKGTKSSSGNGFQIVRLVFGNPLIVPR